MSKGITESVGEAAALDWLGGLGYEVLSGLTIAPGESAAERADYRQVFLFDRLLPKLLSGEYAAAMKVDERTARRHLTHFHKLGLVGKTGDSISTEYQIK